MAECTTLQEIYNSFESSIRDKHIIAESLEYQWLVKAVARYELELETLPFDYDKGCFVGPIPQYVIDTLALYMKQMYQEREVSKVNKRVSIVGKDISIDGNNGSKTAARNELEYVEEQANIQTFHQTVTAYN